MAAGLAAGLALDVTAPGNVIWLIVAATGLTVLASFIVPPPGVARVETADAAGGTLRSPAVLLVVAGGALISASHAVLYAFATLHWTAQGLSGGFVGLLWALGVMAEIVVFAFSARLTALFGPVGLVLAGAAAGVMRFAVLAFDPPAALLPALQLLHGLSFGTTHLGLVACLARAAGAQKAATAQGLSATANAACLAIATAAGGTLYAHSGAGAYLAMAALAGVGGVLVWYARDQPHSAGTGG
jgi:PPP family 3-phenylpropionic acid transporter